MPPQLCPQRASSIVLTIAIVGLLTGTALSPSSATDRDATTSPNVILILADDLAVGDLGPLASDPRHSRTPKLDRLASQSVCFDQAYSGSCVCSPARAALLTGRYPHRTGVVTLNMNKHPQLTRLKLDEKTIADWMREAGYHTGLIGKWHVGRGTGYEPLDRGFDECESFDGSGAVGYYDYTLNINGEAKPFRGEDHYLTDELTDRAIAYVRQHRDEPFFLHLAHYAPHRPLEAPVPIIAKYRSRGFDESTATIYAMIEIMDEGIGRLLDELDVLELSNNTVVIFASDNGPDPLTGERFNDSLRGTKYQCYEGGIRVPLMVRYGNHWTPGHRSQVVSFIDILPTVAELCDVDLSAPSIVEKGLPERGRPIDGASFASVLRDGTAEFSPPRFWQWNRGIPNYTHNAAIRDGQYKLVRPFITRNERIKDSTLPAKLFDLSVDTTESNDLSAEKPSVVKSLGSQLQTWTEVIEQDRQR